MLLLAYILFIFSALVIKRSWTTGLAFALFLWILFGWSSNNADYDQYVLRYTDLGSYEESLEPLFRWVFEFFETHSFSYNQFLIVFSLAFILALTYFTSKLTKNWFFVLGLYAIYPFMMDVVQVRYSMALPFIWFAIYKVLNYASARHVVQAVLAICIASLFHSSSLIFLTILVVPFFKKRLIQTVSLVFVVAGIFLVPQMGERIGQLASMFNVLERVEQYSSLSANDYSIDTRKLLITATLFFTYFIVLTIITRSSVLSANVNPVHLERVEKINYVLLIIIPLLGFMPDIYRIYASLAIVNYTIWGQALSTKHKGLTMNTQEFWLRQLLVGVALINIYFLVFSSVNVNTVFTPLFENNLLFP